MNEKKTKRAMNARKSRRDAMKQIMGLPVLGGLTAGFGCDIILEEEHLRAAEATGKTPPASGTKKDGPANSTSNDGSGTVKVDGVSSATRTSWEKEQLAVLKKPVPQATIKNLKISRLILGGNLIGGWAHARDLIYVSELVKKYHTKEKVFQTFWLAEKCGINMFMGNPVMYPMMADYYSEMGGKIQFICDCGGKKSLTENMLEAIEHGVDGCYIHGGVADRLVANEKYDEIIKAFEVVRKNDIPVGMGAHFLETCKGIVKHGILPDFWMKTFHTNTHYSAKYGVADSFISKEFPRVDRAPGSYCPNENEVAEFMESRPEPWIAFKTLAAGAIHPKVGFKNAFEAGADFLCVGIYDFQMIDDVNICVDILESKLNRKRRMLS